jgi:hypothetical protein
LGTLRVFGLFLWLSDWYLDFGQPAQKVVFLLVELLEVGVEDEIRQVELAELTVVDIGLGLFGLALCAVVL